MREAALTFPATTASSIDGFHPRAIGLLPDEGLEALAAIYQAIEGLGMYPSLLMFLVIQMLGKPKGGYRPIVVFSAIAGLWERARRREAKAWLASMARPYWAFTAGAGAELTVWRQQVKVEANVDPDKDIVVRGSVEGHEEVLCERGPGGAEAEVSPD